MADILVARNISKTYFDTVENDHVTALDGLSLAVRAHEFVSVIGPSGCGKSTFLRIVAGLDRPTSGEIVVSGCKVTGPGADRGMVFQEYALLPWKTTEANIEFGLRLKGMPKDERRTITQRFVDLVGLTGFEKKYPHQLSGGMRQRAAVARVLANNPTVLLMDEPFAALDEITRLKLNDDLAALRSSLGATVVFVTHSVFESVYLSDRIVVMAARPGRAVAEIIVESPTESRQEGFRLCKAYADTCVQTSEALHVAMGDRPPKMLKGGAA
jgi:NitT/TauT family transport system ATP-binding protein